MRIGGIITAGSAALTMTACVAGEPRFEIRSTAQAVTAERQPVPFRIAEAHRHFAFGDIGLALESYRKALRDDPRSVAALSGLAACYDRMGRFDLSRRYFEEALAVSPRDQALLGAFAASLQAQGRSDEAAQVRAEAAGRAAAPAELGSLAPQLAAASERSEVPAGRPSPMEPTPAHASITVRLPEPRAAAPATPATRAAPAAPAAPAAFAAPATPAVAAASPAGPRLERLSLGEVALVTAPQAIWKPQVVAQTRNSTTVRFVPLRDAAAADRIRVLNAARVNRLAARTQTYLGRHGWRSVTIGNASAVRLRSIILYPAGKDPAARKLSQRLGFPASERSGVRQVTILLGRDAAAAPPLRS